MNIKNDRRVLRTRSFLFEALVELLKERPVKDISVKDLTDRANIARPTFYRNYDTIYAILLEELDFRAQGYMIEISKIINPSRSINYIAQILFNRWNDNSELFKAMYRAEMDNFILDRFINYSEELILLINKGYAGDIYRPRLFYFAGGAHNLFKNWLLNGKKQPIKEMSDILARDLFPLVKNPNIILESKCELNKPTLNSTY